MPLRSLVTLRHSPRAAWNLLLLNVFAIRKTSLVTSNLLLQRLSKRALPVCQRQGELPHFNSPAELPCICICSGQRAQNGGVAAAGKLIGACCQPQRPITV